MNPHRLNPNRRGDTLSPTLVSRLRTVAAVGRLRSVRARRILAAVLVVAAVGTMVVAQRTPSAPPLIVAATDLKPGAVLNAEDLTARAIPVAAMPDGAVTAYEDAIGQRLTGPVRRGEIITDTRLLTTRLPESLTGVRGARLVPVRPADEAVANLVQQGDVVDVIDAEKNVLARGAVVAVAPSSPAGRPAGSGVPPVLLAMDETSAQRVAAGSLGTALALILH